MEEAETGKGRRPPLARVGICALNLQLPGLGLLRLERPGQAFAIYGTTIAAFLLVLGWWALSSVPSFGTFVAVGAVFLAVQLALILLSVVICWRISRPLQSQPRPIWSRWYMILAAALAGAVIAQVLVATAHRFYKPFYIPSEAMMPTLLKNDRLVASMRPPKVLRRGDVILFRVDDSTYIKRLAALPGERVAFVNGVMILNGRPVQQQAVGTQMVQSWDGPQRATRLREHFPGELGEHFILDSGRSQEDDLAEQVVAPGHVFVLGDNRDNSADSRVSRAEMGVEQLPIADIQGTALFYTWGPSHKSGQPVH